jgi:cyclohexanecarboxyl-CoA dehydrogenase
VLSFDVSPDQHALAEVLDDFGRKVLLGSYRTRAASTDFFWGVQRTLGEMGVLGIGLPERYGGTGASPGDAVTLGLAAETLARADVNVAASPVQTGLVGAQLLDATPEVQERYLPPVIAGEEVLAIAVTEPSGGSDAAALRTVARPVDGGWLLSGEKIAVTWTMHATAALVYAREPGTQGARGIHCLLVPLDSPGVRTSAMPGMGCLPLGWGSMSFEEVHVPTSHLVGQPGQGLFAALEKFDFSRAALGLLCLGAAQASVDEAAAYACEREAFGKRIASYQGVSFALAEAQTFLDAARWQSYRALWLRDTGRPHRAEAAMSKWWAPTVASDAITAAMRVFGNLGYSCELPIQQRLRDVMSYFSADGSAEIQKRIIAVDMMGPVAAGR